MTQLESGTITLNEAESATVARLRTAHPDQPISFTRRDPGEPGPVLVHVGEMTWEVSGDGKRKKVA